MKIHMIDDDTSFFGTPVEIAQRLRARAHSKSRDLDAYMRKLAADYGFEIDGDDIEDRCDAFLAGMIRVGPARPVFANNVDAHAVRVLRKVIGLSRERLAQLLGVSQMSVTRWETGKHAIDADHFENIKRVLFDPSAGQPATPRISETYASEGGFLATRQRVRDRMRPFRTGPKKPSWQERESHD